MIGTSEQKHWISALAEYFSENIKEIIKVVAFKWL